MPNIVITASRFNDLYGRVRQILGNASGPTYDWDDWYDEFKSTYWGGASKSNVLAAKDFILNLYESNDSFSTSLGTRYGLYRKARAVGIAYWVNDIVALGYSQSQTLYNFFYAAQFSTVVQVDGLTDAQRALTPSKSPLDFGKGTVVSDRGEAGYGYGQTLLSSSVNNIIDVVDDIEYIKLYKDIVRIDAHQNGSGISIDPYVVGDYAINLGSTDKVEDAYISNLETKVASLDANRFDIDIVNQADIVPLFVPSGQFVLSSSRSLQWRTSINHIFTVNFPNEALTNSFFNAGGEIRSALSLLYTGGELKTNRWKNLMAAVGQIRIGYNKTRDSNGITSTKGYADLSTTYTRIYSSNSATSYSNNQIIIDALMVNNSTMQIKIQCQDFHGETIDEYVKGTTSTQMFLAVPNGEILINGQTLDTVVYSGVITGTTISNL